MTPLIRRLQSILREQQQGMWHPYTVPGAWVGSNQPVKFPCAAAYLLHQISTIEDIERVSKQRPWSLDHTLVYNCLVRHATSYDHGPGVQSDGWRSTGTFLKLIGLLPYLSNFGVSTISLLPIMEIGQKGNKGTLGSPYAVKHPFHIETALAEPAVPMSVDDQARCFIECCHALGIKVVTEFVLRTASVDSDLVALNPEWFYWVDEGLVNELGGTLMAPTFTEEQLTEMKEKVEKGDFKGLPEPSEEYQKLFAATPLRVEKDELGWRGIGPKSRTLRIPGAFADWPADDPQPAWTDVTYFRLHDHPHYRYMAYNTLRMYERELETDQYRAHTLRNTIIAVIPHYVRTLNIDGAMIDMGHALPRDMRYRLLKEAKAAKPGFVLFEENFTLGRESVDAGYDACIGYLPFDAHDPMALRKIIVRLANNEIPIRYFATPESHNTPRAIMHMDNLDVVFQTWLFLQLLPGGVNFLHAGMELGDATPVNTGLRFTKEEQEKWPPEKLPLFSDVPLDWDNGAESAKRLALMYRQVTKLETFKRLSFHDVIVPIEERADVIGFWRYAGDGRTGVLVMHETLGEETTIELTMPPDVTFVSAQPGVIRNEREIDVKCGPRETKVIPFIYDATVV